MRSERHVNSFQEGAENLGRRRKAPHRVDLLIAAWLLVLSGCMHAGDAIPVQPNPERFGREYPENFAAAGRRIAQERCSNCHAIDQQSKSPTHGAPPFNTLLRNRDPDELADNLIAGNRVGHEGMPKFDFNIIAADSLLAYLEAIAVESVGVRKAPGR